ncbi:hypothetical protein W824_15085 [Clavibacter cf. michiganensis LMG 26808]|uniref:Nitroreductase domain-containing protein n=1 Tax=Clavibacter michiganensis TaxID=28447 RepID=A0A399NY82_9MICO|nr:hypothetical protein W824_15085 [Clavibacter cf. michiganensis LMG 26808]RII99090.1 hypothetical protein DZF96_00160 [Clavibacter michiganensis]
MERAAACLHEVTRIRRLTPAEAYVGHRSYPSARGIGATTATLLEDGYPGPSVVLHPVPARVPSAYGSLREPLALLEMGHQAANLQLVGTIADLSPALLPPVEDSSKRPLTPAHVRFRGPRPSTAGQQLHEAATGTELPVSVLFDRRTSNPTPAAHIDHADLSAEAMELRGVGQLALLALAEQWPVAAVSSLRLARRPRSEGTSLDLIWVADVRTWVSRGMSVNTLYIAVGWLSQWLCMAAASRDLAIRPMKAFDESDLSSLLHLGSDEQPLYVLRVERRVSSPLERILR